MRRAIALLLLLWPAGASAQAFRAPSSCHDGCMVVTAYRDDDGTKGNGSCSDWDCKDNCYDGHKGTDFAPYGSWSAMDEGRDIVAAAEGVVVDAHDGEFDRCDTGDCAGGSGFGNFVIVEHPDGKRTVYGHMKTNSVAVSVGQSVGCGQQLGQIGSSGYSTGPHVHFEPRVDNVARQPFGNGGCTSPPSYWVDEGPWKGLPSTTCEVVSQCGDGACNGGESQGSCCQDCGCPGGQSCQDGGCVADPVCGDGSCNGQETQGSCCQDCGCPQGEGCNAGVCEPPTSVDPATEAVLSAYMFDGSPTSDVDGDGRADACIRGPSGVRCRLATGVEIAGPALSDENGWADPQNFATLRAGDIDGDGKADLCARADAGLRCFRSTGAAFGAEIEGPALSDADGLGDARFASTLRLADFSGDGKADVCMRVHTGLRCFVSTGTSFGPAIDGPPWADEAGWAEPRYFATIRMGDIDGDGLADVCARASSGVICHRSKGGSWGAQVVGPPFTDNAGYGEPGRYDTLRMLDLDGDGRLDLCIRGESGVQCARSLGDAFTSPFAGPTWSDAAGFGDPSNATTMRAGDIDGDGRDDLCIRADAGVTCQLSTGSGFGPPIAGPALDDASGYRFHRYHHTLRLADVTGDGKADLCVRASDGVHCHASTGSGFTEESLWGLPSDAAGYGEAPCYATLRLAGPPRARESGAGGAGGAAGRGGATGASGKGGAKAQGGATAAGAGRAGALATGGKVSSGGKTSEASSGADEAIEINAESQGETEATLDCGCRAAGRREAPRALLAGALALLLLSRRAARRASCRPS